MSTLKTTTIRYPSADGTSTIRALLWEPDDPPAAPADGDSTSASAAVADPAPAPAPRPRAVVQIVHGMAEHVERYTKFAAYLVDHGFVACAEDHVGHGKSVSSPEDLGHIPLKAGEDILMDDVHALRRQVMERYEGVPYVLFGHSMGSYMARVYLTRHPEGVEAAIICGTGQTSPVLCGLGRALIQIIRLFKGERYRSKLVDSMSTGSYLKGIENPRTSVDWICTDPAVCDAYVADPLAGEMFTLGGYNTLMKFVQHSQKAKLTARIPKSLPMFFIAGSEDPVGECGKGVDRAVEQYREAGIEVVDEKIYEGYRHEVLNEPIGPEVMDDIDRWLQEQGV